MFSSLNPLPSKKPFMMAVSFTQPIKMETCRHEEKNKVRVSGLFGELGLPGGLFSGFVIPLLHSFLHPYVFSQSQQWASYHAFSFSYRVDESDQCS